MPVNKVTLKDLHERSVHILFDTLKSLPEALPFRGTANPPICEACIKGKSTKPPARKAEKQVRSSNILEKLHTDLIGPFSKEWLGKKYVLTAMDDYTRYCTAIPIKANNDTKRVLQEWIKMLVTQCKARVTYLQADCGGEFRNTELATWCKKKGIQLKKTVPRHSKTNAIIERLNRTLATSFPALLYPQAHFVRFSQLPQLCAYLPLFYWSCFSYKLSSSFPLQYPLSLIFFGSVTSPNFAPSSNSFTDPPSSCFSYNLPLSSPPLGLFWSV